MGKQENIEETIHILESIIQRANLIHGNPDRELCLDIDLMLEDLRMLYRKYEILKKQCDAVPVDTKISTADSQTVPSFFTDAESETVPEANSKGSTAPPKEVVSPAPSASPVPQSATEDSDQTTAAPEAQHRHEPSLSEKPRVSVKSDMSVPDTAKKGDNGKTVIDLFSQNPTRSIGDQFGNEDKSLHQRISSQKEDRSIGTRLQQHPVANIKDAIGLNEKFLFINELFQGDIQAYNEALTRLNSMGSLKEAFEFLNNLTNVHQWDANRSAETVEKLAGFVQRRYLDR